MKLSTHIDFQNLPNTRDLGGMPAADGKVVAPGRLLRSGMLFNASPDDLHVLLDRYRVRTVIDLRSPQELVEQPDPQEQMPGVRFVHLPLSVGNAPGVERNKGALSKLSSAYKLMRGPVPAIVDMYRDIALGDVSTQGIAQFFRELQSAPDDTAVLWHCTAGKDRVGITTFLLETVLGVPQQVAEADYELTNRYTAAMEQDLRERIDPQGTGRMEKVIKVINAADPRYLQGALKAIDKQCGSMEAYLRDKLGITPDVQAALRDKFLVSE